MRVAHLISHHSPRDTRVFHKECRTLAAHGYEVHLVATTAPAPEIDGVQFQAVETSAAQLPGTRRRFQRAAHHLASVLRVYQKARSLRADVYHIHEPLLILAGLGLKARRNRVIYDAHEDSPRNAIALNRGFHSLLLSAVWSVLEQLAGVFFDGLAAATPVIAKRYPSHKTAVVRNFPDLAEFKSADKSLPFEHRHQRVVYVGGLFRERGVLQMVQAMELLANSEAELILAGRFRPPELENEASLKAGWSRTQFRPWLAHEEIVSLLSSARVGLVLLHPNTAYKESLPVKLFEYMASGLPVVASEFPLWKAIVDGAGCGILVNPLDTQGIASAIDYLLENAAIAEEMGRRGRRAVEALYNWDNEKGALLALYNKVLA